MALENQVQAWDKHKNIMGLILSIIVIFIVQLKIYLTKNR